MSIELQQCGCRGRMVLGYSIVLRPSRAGCSWIADIRSLVKPRGRKLGSLCSILHPGVHPVGYLPELDTQSIACARVYPVHEQGLEIIKI